MTRPRALYRPAARELLLTKGSSRIEIAAARGPGLIAFLRTMELEDFISLGNASGSVTMRAGDAEDWANAIAAALDAPDRAVRMLAGEATD